MEPSEQGSDIRPSAGQASDDCFSALPESAEALQSLLDDAKGVLHAIGRRTQLNTEMIVLCEEGIRDPTTLPTISHRMAQLAGEAPTIGVSPPAYLLVYLPSQFLSNLSLRGPLAELAAVTEKKGLKRIEQMSHAIRARRDADSAMAVELNLLIARIHAQLGLLGAENEAEKSKNVRRPLPRNKKVVELARRIKLPRNQDRAQNEIALEVTDADEAEAENILRQLRDRPELLQD